MRMTMKQSGFTLLEGLGAVLVLAIGLLGLAGLMTASVRNNQSAYQRTQATWLAYDVVARMRVNRAAALDGGYNTAIGTPATCAAHPARAGAVDRQPGNRCQTGRAIHNRDPSMKPPMTHSRTSSQAGFSLVELMLAVTIGFSVIGAVGYLYIGSRGAFRTADNMSRMQETARYAMDTLTRDIRMAGYRVCASGCGTFDNTLIYSALNAYNFGQPLAGYDAQVAG